MLKTSSLEHKSGEKGEGGSWKVIRGGEGGVVESYRGCRERPVGGSGKVACSP